MNEFERKIREAMAVTRNNANPRPPRPARWAKPRRKSPRCPSARGRWRQAAAGKRRRGGAPNIRRMKRKPPPRKAPNPRGDRRADAAPTSSGLFGRAALSKPG